MEVRSNANDAADICFVPMFKNTSANNSSDDEAAFGSAPARQDTEAPKELRDGDRFISPLLRD
jgi:hypothetical protein